MDMARPDYEVVIVGSGFGGLCMGVRLKQAGIDNFVILEKDKEFGGTWWANHYPGCAVDVPSYLYSFSFAQRPAWTRRFASQGELLDYTRGVVRDFGLAPHIRADTAMLGGAFDEEDGFWRVLTSRGILTARSLVAATGTLSRPSIPDFPGLSRFQGKTFHSSQWDHGVDLRGKRVAVIGTGASAIQFVPEIAPQVAHLDLYQRTPPWILPRPDRAITRAEQALMKAAPPLQRLARCLDYLRHEARAIAMVYLPASLRSAEWLARRHLARQVADPDLRARLTPDYRIGCKRILLMNTYYPALTRPNVQVHAGAVREVTASGVVGADGVERAADVIIFGTGFDVEQAMGGIDILGRGGKALHDAAHGLQAYKGCTIAGFPNLFVITGPNTGLGHNSIIYMIECASAYIRDAILTMRAEGLDWVDVKPEVQAAYNDKLQRRMQGTVWASGCRSWYIDRNGSNRVIWPGFTFVYRWITRRFDRANYIAGKAGA